MSLRISCVCGNTELISNKMDNFTIDLVKFLVDSGTGKIKVVCKACKKESEEILIGN